MLNTSHFLAFAIFIGWAGGAAAQTQRFSYPPHVIAEAQRQANQREQEWRACFVQMVGRWSGGAATWRDVSNMFRACREAELRYVRAALRAAQREYPEPRTDQYGRIVAWDQINSHNRTMRRQDWLRFRREFEDRAMNAMRLPYRCEWRTLNNSGTIRSGHCHASDFEMGMDTFDFQQ